jgi:HEAT repeat protein
MSSLHPRSQIGLIACCVILLVTSSVSGQPQPDDREVQNIIKDLENPQGASRSGAAAAVGELGSRAVPFLPRLINAFMASDLEIDEEFRLNLAKAFAKIGPPAVKAWTSMLPSKHTNHRAHAALALGLIGPEAKSALGKVMEALSDKREIVRSKAAFALGRIGADPALAVPLLTKLLKDEDEVSSAAAEALSKFGVHAVPVLIDHLEGRQFTLAAHALGEIGDDAKAAVPSLQKIMLAKDQDQGTVSQAAQALVKIGKTAWPALKEAIADERQEVRDIALRAVLRSVRGSLMIEILGDRGFDGELRSQLGWRLGGLKTKSAINAFVLALKDDHEKVRRVAARGLSILGAAAKEAAPKLLEALFDVDPEVGVIAFIAVKKMGEDPLKVLQGALSHRNPRDRILAARVMVAHGDLDAAPAIAVLREGLKEKDPGVRVLAARGLAEKRLDVDKLLPLFIEGLKHEKPAVRHESLRGLQALGKFFDDAIPAILGLIDDPELSIRVQIVPTIEKINNTGETLVPVLGKLTKDKDINLRLTAVKLLSNYDDGLRYLVDTLQEKDARVRIAVTQVLWRYRDKGFPALVQALKDKDARVRSAAVEGVGWYKDKSLAHLIEALSDDDESVRQKTVWMLSYAEGDRKTALAALAKLMKSSTQRTKEDVMVALSGFGEMAVPILVDAVRDDKCRLIAIGQIVAMGSPARKAAPLLIELFAKDPDPAVRMQAAVALLAQGNDSFIHVIKDIKSRNIALKAFDVSGDLSKEVVLFVIESMKENSAETRRLACRVLGKNSPQASLLLSALQKALEDEDSGVRAQAISSLSAMEDKGRAILVSHWKNAKERDVRLAIAESLRSSPYHGADLLPIYADGLARKDDPEVRLHAAVLLRLLGNEAAVAAPVLVESLGDSDEYVRAEIVKALLAIGKAAYPALLDSLKKSDAAVRQSALQLLLEQKYNDKAGVPELIDALKDMSAYVRARAAALLGAIGPDAKAAVAPLEDLCRDSDAQVRQAAISALKRIKGQ